MHNIFATNADYMVWRKMGIKMLIYQYLGAGICTSDQHLQFGKHPA